ncbi:MAG: endonuclease [Pseudomonadota bacterium]
MADVNWKQYNCNVCRMVCLLGAAVLAGLIATFLIGMGLSPVPLVLIVLIISAVLLFVFDGYCVAKASAPMAASSAVAKVQDEIPAAKASAADTMIAKDAADAAAKAKEDAAAAAAAAKAAADAKAAEEAEAAETTAKDAAVAAEKVTDGSAEGADAGMRPEALDGPRDGQADDLKRIKGIGPKLETLCHSLGFYHFDQIAGWTADEIAWVDENLAGFRGRVTRDDWVAQAKTLSAGGETDFSKRVDDGAVPSSQ